MKLINNVKSIVEFNYSGIISLVINLLLIIILFGCAGTQIPLSPPGDVPVDKQLLGDWIEIDSKEDSIPDKMKVYQFNDNEYLLKYMWIDTTGQEMYLIRAFTTLVDDILFANVQCLGCDDDNDYAFFRYTLTNEGILKVLPVKTEFYCDPIFSTSAELFDFIKNHLDDNEIYEPETLFIRDKK